MKINKELSIVRSRKVELDRARTNAINDVKLAKEKTVKDYFESRDSKVKKVIDEQLGEDANNG